ncbi:hypothetical protein EJB05_43462, partial [Eragrostis curvula]
MVARWETEPENDTSTTQTRRRCNQPPGQGFPLARKVSTRESQLSAAGSTPITKSGRGRREITIRIKPTSEECTYQNLSDSSTAPWFQGVSIPNK